MTLLERLKFLFSDSRGEVEVGASPAETSAPSGPGTNSGDAGAPPGDNGGEVSWADVLPDEAKNDPEIAKYKTPEDFYKGYKNKLELIGKKGIIPPGENATPEEKAAFYEALGRPKTPDEYKFNPVEGVHESIKTTPETEAAFKKFAYENGISQQHADLFNQYAVKALDQAVKNQVEAEAEAARKAETALRAEWGDKFEANKNLVAKGMLKYGGQEALDAMGGVDGIGNNPHVLKGLAKILGMLGEDTISSIVNQGPSGSASAGEKQAAKARIEAIQQDPAFFDSSNVKHKELIAERSRLYDILHGDTAA